MRTIPRSGTAVSSVIITLACAGLLAQAQTGSLADRALARIRAGRIEAGAPGISAAIARGDKIVWSGADGLADIENDVPARAATVYRIASISKPIAATALMQLVERGRVSLDDPVRKYLPFFPDKGGLTLTVRHVLTHTSGIRHYKPGEMESVIRYDNIAEAAKIFEDDPLLFTPGTKYSYSTYA